MLSARQAARFAADGFVLGSRVLTADAVEELRAELARVIDDHGGDGPQPVRLANLSGDPAAPVWQIVNICDASPAFMALVHHPVIVEEVVQLTGAAELRLWHDQIQYKPAAIGGVNMWHQDSPYWPSLEPKDAQLTAWVALDDVDPDNGCMSMVPGSHHWGNQIGWLHGVRDFEALPPQFEGRPTPAVCCPVAAGGVHYHHSLTWHGSAANRSGRPRRAVALHYMTERTVFHRGGGHLMEPFIASGDGEKVEGARFPLVWTRD
jgi:hypothetical protein